MNRREYMRRKEAVELNLPELSRMEDVKNAIDVAVMDYRNGGYVYQRVEIERLGLSIEWSVQQCLDWASRCELCEVFKSTKSDSLCDRCRGDKQEHAHYKRGGHD